MKCKYLQNQTGWCQETCRDHPGASVDGLHRLFHTIQSDLYTLTFQGMVSVKPFEIIQNLMLMHKLMRIHIVFLLAAMTAWLTQLSGGSSTADCM